jgi:peptidoglycan hydrolase-like protein with peptidoglycan-binding domain
MIFMRPVRLSVLAATTVILALTLGCSEEGSERRARDAAEKIKEAIPNRMAVALSQKAEADDVRQAQEVLTRLKEYMGEVNGTLDAVTVNAIQAFQRAQGLDDDGILDDKTKRLLKEAAAGPP